VALRDDRLPEETDFTRLAWVKSSYSGEGEDPQCVEIAVARDMVFVRDSKAFSSVLGFTPRAWREFVAGISPR